MIIEGQSDYIGGNVETSKKGIERGKDELLIHKPCITDSLSSQRRSSFCTDCATIMITVCIG